MAIITFERVLTVLFILGFGAFMAYCIYAIRDNRKREKLKAEREEQMLRLMKLDAERRELEAKERSTIGRPLGDGYHLLHDDHWLDDESNYKGKFQVTRPGPPC